MSYSVAKAEIYLLENGRLLDRVLYDVRYHSADPERVLSLIKSYQNDDGGIGNALEPDVRCRESQPLSTEVGLLTLKKAGIRNGEISNSICGFLQSVATKTGLVPMLLPSAFEHPRAPHWTSVGDAGLNPTAGICGLLHWQSIEHPWLKKASDTCCELLLNENENDVHALLSATYLAEHLPDRQLAKQLFKRISELLPNALFYIPFAPAKTYGLTPLEFAPSPESMWRTLFTDEQMYGHLQQLASSQESDGGWPISWKTVSEAAKAEWRGRGTVNAINALSAYGVSEDSFE